MRWQRTQTSHESRPSLALQPTGRFRPTDTKQSRHESRPSLAPLDKAAGRERDTARRMTGPAFVTAQSIVARDRDGLATAMQRDARKLGQGPPPAGDEIRTLRCGRSALLHDLVGSRKRNQEGLLGGQTRRGSSRKTRTMKHDAAGGPVTLPAPGRVTPGHVSQLRPTPAAAQALRMGRAAHNTAGP